MTPHLTDRDMELFATNDLPPAELLTADRHLQECGRCRSSLSQISGGAKGAHDLRKALGSVLAGDHLTFEELASCADGAAESPILSQVRSHLKSCSECRSEVAQLEMLRATETGVPTASESRPNFFVSLRSFFASRIAIAGISVLLVCVALGAWLISRQSDDSNGASVGAVNTGLISNELAQALDSETADSVLPENNISIEDADVTVNPIRDDGVNVGLDRSGKLVGYNNLSSKQQQMLERSLKSQTVDIGREISELKQPSGALMGDAEGANKTFGVNGPFGKVISTDRPTISWQELAGAESYTVEVYDSKFKKVVASGSERSTTWSPKLARGRTYILQVVAVKDGVETKAPRRPAPEARFHVLAAQKLSEIESAKRAHPKANLLLGLLYAKYGMLDEATESLRALLKENPRSSTVRKLLEKVQSASR